jgi:hypothetical protein
MRRALHFFAPFLVLPLLWVYFSYIHLPSHRKAPPLPPATPEMETKAAPPKEPGQLATETSPLTMEKTLPHRLGEPESPRTTTQADHTDANQIPPPKHFLHEQFSVTDRRDFTFIVPPNIVNPKLQGSFRVFTKADSGANRQTAEDIDFALMDDRQFDDFVHGRRADAAYEETATGEEISFSIPPTHEQERYYHVVFMTESARPVMVDADFTVTFQ